MRDMNNLKGQKNLGSVYIYIHVFKKCVLNITQKQFLNRFEKIKDYSQICINCIYKHGNRQNDRHRMGSLQSFFVKATVSVIEYSLN